MKASVVIRRPRPSEHSSIRTVVQTVVDETYGGLWAPPPLQIDEIDAGDWSLAWISVVEVAITGIVLGSFSLLYHLGGRARMGREAGVFP